MMNAATSRYPFAMEPFANPRAGNMRSDNNLGNCNSIGLGINNYDQSTKRNNSISSTSSVGHGSPWFTPSTGNLPVSQLQQMHQGQTQTQPPQPPQSQAQAYHHPGTAAQWVTPSANSSPKSLAESNSTYELTQKLEEKDAMVCDLKLQVEALMTAITLGNAPESGSMDGAELAHRILTRIKTLRSENERLMALASHNHAAQLEMELDLLKQENAALRKQISH